MITVAGVGDIAPIDYTSCQALESAEEWISSIRADVIIANLESPIGLGTPASGKIRVSAPAEAVSALQRSGITAVNLANNHFLDHGEVAARRTLKMLEAAQVGYFGLRVGSRDYNPLTLRVGSESIAFLGFAAPSTHPRLRDGTVEITALNGRVAEKTISAVRRAVDYVVVALHWGLQDQYLPTREQVSAAHSMIDAGADAVLGHHAHVPQVWQEYGRGVIFYGLGNAVFPSRGRGAKLAQAEDPEQAIRWHSWNTIGLVALVAATASGATIQQVVFTRFDGKLWVPLTRFAEGGRLRRQLARGSRLLGTPVYPLYQQLSNRYAVLVHLARAWWEGGRRMPTRRHAKALFSRVLMGRHPELDRPFKGDP